MMPGDRVMYRYYRSALERQEALGSLHEWFLDVVRPEAVYVNHHTVRY